MTDMTLNGQQNCKSILCRRVSVEHPHQSILTQINQNNVDDTRRCETKNSKALRLARDFNMIGPQYQS